MNLTDLIFEKKDFLHKDDCEAWIDWFWLNQQYHDKGDSGNEEKHKKDFLPYCLFNELKSKVLVNIDDIYAQEAGLYSDKYKVAGRADCIAHYRGVPSVMDFKTSTKERNDDWNENYYIQGTAYAEMFHARTGIEIDQVVILVVTEDGTVQEFVKDKEPYIDLLNESLAEWRNQNETPNINNGGVSVNGLSNH